MKNRSSDCLTAKGLLGKGPIVLGGSGNNASHNVGCSGLSGVFIWMQYVTGVYTKNLTCLCTEFSLVYHAETFSENNLIPFENNLPAVH